LHDGGERIERQVAMKWVREGTGRDAARLLSGVFVLASVLGSSSLRADDDGEWVEVAGEAAIVGDNEVGAREAARDQALRRAVEQVAGTLVTAHSETRDFISVRDEITSQAAGFVRRYDVTGTNCADGICRVTLRALVARRTLENRLTELGLIVQRRGNPRVILLIAEQNADAEMASTWWGRTGVRSQYFENELIDFLNKALVDDGRCRSRLPREAACWNAVPASHAFRFSDYTSISVGPEIQATAGTDLTDEQARHLAGLTDAEVALIGTARARKLADLPTAGNVQMISVGGSASLRVIDVNSGQVLTTVNVETPATTHINAAQAGEVVLRHAARQAAVELQRRIADAWSAEASGTRWVRLEVEGIRGYADLQALRAALEHEVTGVQAVHQRRMEGSSALLEIQTSASAEQLANALSGRRLGQFTVQVTRIDSSVVAVEVGY
jgi:hypothetical protein